MSLFTPIEALGVLGDIFVTGGDAAGGAGKLYEVATGMLGGASEVTGEAEWFAGALEPTAWFTATRGAGG
jgi:hypothetical protein